MIRTYEIDFDWKASVKVEVDHSVFTDEVATMINGFWMGADDRLHCEDGNLIKAVLKMLAARIFAMDIELGIGVSGLIALFDNEEGWPKMNGSDGIKIVSLDGLTFEPEDMSVSVVG